MYLITCINIQGDQRPLGVVIIYCCLVKDCGKSIHQKADPVHRASFAACGLECAKAHETLVKMDSSQGTADFPDICIVASSLQQYPSFGGIEGKSPRVYDMNKFRFLIGTAKEREQNKYN